MPRSTGKAARRRARQRKGQATVRPTAPSAEPVAPSPSATVATEPAERVAASEPRAQAPRRREREVTGSSRLTGAAAAEYGYVARELRSIGVLSAALLVVLAICWLAFNALGLVAT